MFYMLSLTTSKSQYKYEKIYQLVMRPGRIHPSTLFQYVGTEHFILMEFWILAFKLHDFRIKYMGNWNMILLFLGTRKQQSISMVILDENHSFPLSVVVAFNEYVIFHDFEQKQLFRHYLSICNRKH